MLGTTLVLPDISGSWGGPWTTPIPDLAAGILTLQLRNQDNFGSVYGVRGALHDHLITIRNIRESQQAGQPLITRHSAEYAMTLRPTVAAGITTPAVPYRCSMVMRFPETGLNTTMVAMLGELAACMNFTAGTKTLKMINFES